MKAKRYFNTSGPNNPSKHYTLFRENLIELGKELVYNERYFTIWAPRQTGKSTYFRLLAKELEKDGYLVAYINLENFKNGTEKDLFDAFQIDFLKFWKINIHSKTINQFGNELQSITNQKLVFICDEIEGLNPDLLNQFLHTIRSLYHSREHHSLKSVVLVGVSNITGIVQDNASPFNIADELDVPYFSDQETIELLAQHEAETGQLFELKVKQKISEITANQPGLVNGFAKRLVDLNPNKPKIEYEDYLIVEDWYLTKVIDKNISNVLNKATKHREFVERLLFTEAKIPFTIERPAIKDLHINGLIRSDKDGYVEFWVTLYRKRIYDAFYPYSNGESKRIEKEIPLYDIVTKDGHFYWDKLIDTFKAYISRRSFRPFREKDENGKFKSIPEAVMVYSFETFIQSFLQMLGAKSYREAQVSLGNSDLIINVLGKEYLVETKIYRYDKQFQEGKKQLAYYCKKLGLKEGVYLVFVPNNILYPELAKEGIEVFEEVSIRVYLVQYDEEKEFGE